MAGLLTYYPNEGYLKKNLKPESIPVEYLSALAKAEKLARQSGVLSQKVADAFLANALVEGRFQNSHATQPFGFNSYGYPVTPQRTDRFKKMGISIGPYVSAEAPPESDNWDMAQWDLWEERKKRAAKPMHQIGIGQENPDEMLEQSAYIVQRNAPGINPEFYAKMAAITLAEKAALYGEDRAVERWNGKGVAKNFKGKVVANANNHAKKVSEMMKMLAHPSNLSLMNQYQGLLR